MAIVGAECTGKTQLARNLAQRLQASVPHTAWVGEYLRDWCTEQGRTPQANEQRAISQGQMERVLAAAGAHVVLSDTAPLVTAVYSDVLFGDTSLYADAIEQHRSFQLTLLTGLDLPWVADGFQRDGPALRAQVDQRLRAVLLQEGIAFSTVYGRGEARTEHALGVIEHALRAAQTGTPAADVSNWAWHCASCSDADCEHRLFRAILAR